MESPAGHTRVMWKGYELNPTDPPRKPQNIILRINPNIKPETPSLYSTGDTLALFNRRHQLRLSGDTEVKVCGRGRVYGRVIGADML